MQALGPRALPWIPEALDAGWQGEPDGAQWWAALLGALLQHAQDHDLQRLERNPAKHHLAPDSWAVSDYAIRARHRPEHAAGIPAALLRAVNTTSSGAATSSWARRYRNERERLAGARGARRAVGIGFREEHGGFGGPTEVMLVMEEIGAALVLEPYHEHGRAVAARCCGAWPCRSSRRRSSRASLRANCRLALAHQEQDARYALDFVETTARGAGDSTC